MAAMLISAQAVDYDGAVLSGAKLNVYDAGTTTPRAIYASKDLASGASSANPAVATATGGIAVWVDDSAGDIKVTLTNSAGTTTYYSQDNIDPTNGNIVVFPLGGQDQTLSTTDSVTFASLTLGAVSFAGVAADPGSDRLMFWDDSDTQVEWLTLDTGLSIATNTLSLDAQLVDIAGLTPTDGNIIVGDGTNFVTESGATARTSLGLGAGNSPDFAGISLGGGTTYTAILDEDAMGSDSATSLASQQSIKAYVDNMADTVADINAITQADGTFIVSDGTNWIGETGATLRTSIGLNALPDTEFKVADNADATKLGAFQLSGVTTGNTRTLTWPDFDGTIATLAGAETLTNKTLTSPVLNTGVSGTAFLDEDDMVSDSATKLASQQSIKAYVDDWYTPEQFGCVGDDSTDDATNLQTAVNTAVTDKKILEIRGTYAVGSAISIPADAHIRFREGAYVRLTASGAVQAFLVTGSNVVIENMRLKGPFPSEPASLVSGTHYDTVATRTRGNNGIEVFKAIGTRIKNLTLVNPHVSGFGFASYWFEHLTDSRLIAPVSERVGKYGLIGLSCDDIEITAPNFSDHGPGQGGTGVLLNQYGIMWTRDAADTLANAPVCNRCTTVGGSVADVPTWEGLDTHGGNEITFIGVSVRNVAFGAVAINADGTSEKVPPTSVLFEGCYFLAGSTKCSGANVSGSDADNPSLNVRYVNCVFDGFGGTENSVDRGAAEAQNAKDTAFFSCRWVNSSYTNLDINGGCTELVVENFDFGTVAPISGSAYHIRADAATVSGRIGKGRADMANLGNTFMRLTAASSPGYGVQVAESEIDFHYEGFARLIDHKPALAIASNFDVATANTVDVAIGGTEYAVAAGTWDTGTSAVIAANKWGIALLSTDGTTPTRVVTWETNSGAGYATENEAIANCPATPADEAAVGFVTVQAHASNSFTAGTDALTTGTGGNVAQTTTYYNDRFPLPAYRIYSAGEVGRQYAVGGAPIAFSAYYAASAGNVTGNATNYIMVYDTEYYDEGSVYNTSTGAFTAPVAGIYTFSVGYDVSGITGMNDLRTYLDVAGTVYDLFRHDPTNMLYNTNRITLSAAREVFVPKGGVVRVRTAISGGALVADVIGSATTPSNYFSGRLIRPAVNE